MVYGHRQTQKKIYDHGWKRARVSGSATDVASIYDHGWKMADASRRGLRDGNAGRVSVDG